MAQSRVVDLGPADPLKSVRSSLASSPRHQQTDSQSESDARAPLGGAGRRTVLPEWKGGREEILVGCR